MTTLRDEDPLALAQTAFELVEADAAAAARRAERALGLARAQQEATSRRFTP
jgi:hypothetical protein